MNKLTAVDQHFITSRIPKDVVELLKSRRVFLAGGFIRACIAGETPADIDLLGADERQLEAIALELATNRNGRVHQTDNALTVLAPPRTPVQFITRWLYDDPKKLVEQFDFTIVQAVIWWVPGDSETVTGEWRSLCADSFYSDLAARRLVYTAPHRHEDAGGSIMRVLKYLGRGYNIQAPALAGVVARLLTGIRIDDGMVVHQDDAARLDEQKTMLIILSLLLEVDPLSIIDGIEPVMFNDESSSAATSIEIVQEGKIDG
jgi:hypothetical protein